MCAHQGDRLVRQALRQRHALFVVRHQHVRGPETFRDIEDRDPLRQEGRVVEAGPHRRLRQSERNDRRRMAVHHRTHIGTRGVDLAMDEAFKEALRRLGIAGLARKVVFHDILGRHQSRGQCPRHQVSLGRARVAHRDMAETVDDAPRRKDARGRSQIGDPALSDGAARCGALGHQMITLVATLAGKMSSGANWRCAMPC